VLSRRRGTAIITTYHGVEAQQLARATRVLSMTSDLVVGVGPTTTWALEQIGLPRDRSATVYNSISINRTRSVEEVRKEFGIPDDAQLVVSVGRYAPQKNQALLIRALARLMTERSALRALLVGVGDLEDELRAQTVQLGIEDQVQITGPRADAHDLIAASDVFALSSAWEGLPLVVLEAMELEVPVISTAVGGVEDAVADGETGLLVRPDDEAALAEGLARLLDDEALRKRLAAAAKAGTRVNCTEEAMVARYLELYVEALTRRRRGR
jgi:glycosyltransferase involved in cell wall biosynthesis